MSVKITLKNKKEKDIEQKENSFETCKEKLYLVQYLQK